nr:MAG TPA_asm: hypothetical protein [Caudoviricetes sp.]
MGALRYDPQGSLSGSGVALSVMFTADAHLSASLRADRYPAAHEKHGGQPALTGWQSRWQVNASVFCRPASSRAPSPHPPLFPPVQADGRAVTGHPGSAVHPACPRSSG